MPSGCPRGAAVGLHGVPCAIPNGGGTPFCTFPDSSVSVTV